MDLKMAALRWGGVAVYGVVAYAVTQGTHHGQQSPLGGPPALTVLWALLMLALMWCYWKATDLGTRRRVRLRWTFGMVALNVSLLPLLPGNSDQNLLLILSSAVLPSVLNWPQVVGVVSLQALWILLVEMRAIGWYTTLLNAVLWLVVQLALALLLRFTTDERRALRALSERNVELRTTQALLEHASREAERMRIARDLHDMLGHHLTVLSIDLELAELALETADDLPDTASPSLTDPAPDDRAVPLTPAREALARARCAQRRLMADVRGAVQVLRDPQPGLAAFADELRQSVPQLQVHITLPETGPFRLERVEGVLMRFMQESLTNTLRHAHARHLWLDLISVPGGVQVQARDDGRLRRGFRPGHGLTGLRERFEHAGGSLSVCAQGPSLRLEGFVPLPGP